MIRKGILLLLACGISCLSGPLDIKIIPNGLWPYCSDSFPEYCIPKDQESYLILIKPSGDDVKAFRYNLTYIQAGEVRTVSKIGDCVRGDAVYCAAEVVLGVIESVISLHVEELVVK